LKFDNYWNISFNVYSEGGKVKVADVLRLMGFAWSERK